MSTPTVDASQASRRPAGIHPDERARVKNSSPIATSQLPYAVEVPREITTDDFESLASALTLTESEVDDLCAPFTERWVDVERSGVGRADLRFAQTDDAQELFA
jgi:hypothetical protein